jgi:hypothetical protein
MAYDFKFERSLFLHGIDNPPHADLTCSITLAPINSTGAFNLIKFGMGHQTEYIVEVENPLQIGFTSSEQLDQDHDLKNFALAMNLALDRNCVTLHPAGFVQNKPVLKPIKETPAKVTKVGNEFRIEIHETVRVSDHVSVGFGTTEDIDESIVISIFRRLQNTNRFDVTKRTPIKASNLAKALQEFELAMNSFDRLQIFKHLNTAIEIAANYDGSADDDPALDGKVSQSTGVSQTDAETWRRLYARAKHPDATPQQIEKYLDGNQNLSTLNVKVRACAKAVLLTRL